MGDSSQYYSVYKIKNLKLSSLIVFILTCLLLFSNPLLAQEPKKQLPDIQSMPTNNENTGVVPSGTEFTKLSENFAGCLSQFVVSGDYAYISAGYGGLKIVDVATPGNLVNVGEYDYGAPISDVEFQDNYVFAASGDAGLAIINVSDPSKPNLVSKCGVTNYIFGVSVYGDYAFLAGNGLHIIDISDLKHPTLVTTLQTGDGNETQVYAYGNYAYILSYGGVRIIDISNIQAPSVVGEWTIANMYHGIFDFFVNTALNHIYLACDNEIVILDISNPSNPTIIGKITVPSLYSIAYTNDYILTGDRDGNLAIINATLPAEPSIISSIAISHTGIEDIVIQNNIAYVTSRVSGLFIVDLTNINSLAIIGRFDKGGYAYNVFFFDEHYACLSMMSEGLYIVDVKDLYNPMLVEDVTVGKAVNDIELVGTTAYLADFYEGLIILDLSNPVYPHVIGNYTNEGNFTGIAVKENYAYITDLYKGLTVLDISAPQNPVFVANVTGIGLVYDIAIEGGRAYVVGSNGLTVIDITDSLSPKITTSFSSNFYTWFSITVKDSIAYISSLAGIVTLDVSGTSVKMLGSINVNVQSNNIVLNDTKLYIGTYSGIRVYDVSDPTEITLEGLFEGGATVSYLDVVGDLIYVAGTEEGLEIFKTYLTEATPTNQVFVPSLVIAVTIISLASIYTKKQIKL